MSDQQITCGECGGSFVFTESERSFYESKGLAVPPKRCKACRQARKAERDAGGGGRDARPARGGDFARGGYDRPRAPRADGASRGGFDRPRAPRPDAPQAGGWGRMGASTDGWQPRRDGGPVPQSYGDRPASRSGRPEGRGPYSGPRAEGGRPPFQPDRPRGDAPPDRPRPEVREFVPGGFGPRSKRDGAQRDGRPAPRDARPPKAAKAGAPRSSKKKADRPKFDVTCVECGTATQVPFKPIEGRDVFCQPCYKARRGTAPEGALVAEVTTQPDAMAPASEESMTGAPVDE